MPAPRPGRGHAGRALRADPSLGSVAGSGHSPGTSWLDRVRSIPIRSVPSRPFPVHPAPSRRRWSGLAFPWCSAAAAPPRRHVVGVSGRGEAAASGRGGPGIRLHPSAPPVSTGPGPAPPRRGPPRTRRWAHIGGGSGRRGPRPPRRRAAAGALRRRSRPAPCRGRGLGPLLAGRGRGGTLGPRARPRGRSGNGDGGYCWGGAGPSQLSAALARARPAGGCPSFCGAPPAPGEGLPLLLDGFDPGGAPPRPGPSIPGGSVAPAEAPLCCPQGSGGCLGSVPPVLGAFRRLWGSLEGVRVGAGRGREGKSRQSFPMCWVTLGVLCLCGVFLPPCFYLVLT